ncbi:uncharacterized protein FIBRA_04994 [Fibroporia radiculosa]|uniref:Uncharacterized protein n=1 Tax=Fibroporia radiculosa TaxID=599839 RepID=J4GQ80_9APHY|nr:uncharacterized protein FIBRA_04994 [Fibroporia radiculosa]CCM02880.1 predicted protein [Fibroporia radiculosa]
MRASFSSSAAHTLAGPEERRHSAPGAYIPAHAGPAESIACSVGAHDSSTRSYRNRALSLASRLVRPAQSLPALSTQRRSSSTDGPPAIVYLQLSVSEGPSPRRGFWPGRHSTCVSLSEDSCSPPLTTVLLEDDPLSNVGLGLGLPVEFHTPIDADRPATTTAEIVASSDYNGLRRRNSSSNQVPVYSICPPGLDTVDVPTTGINAQQTCDQSVPPFVTREMDTQSLLSAHDYTIDIVPPTPPLSDPESMEFLQGEISPPGAPQLQSINRFRADSLYG